MKIFLSGGTHGDWQDQVKKAFANEYFFDPREASSMKTMREIAELERSWLDKCDIVFFYFEKSNPSGLGSAFEIGYCISKGIPVIMVDEKMTSHSEWLSVHCNIVCNSFENGIVELKKWVNENK